MQQCCKNTEKKSHRILQRTVTSLALAVWLWSSFGLALHHHHDGQIHEDCPYYFFSIAITWDGVVPDSIPYINTFPEYEIDLCAEDYFYSEYVQAYQPSRGPPHSV
ncbi:MAG TPA: hypothetical protein ENN84_04360 [Candidatus Marinimicrobia bacterium]|nr:hypothetical protein [Candidatus Neomarinimicrobiota bacterium]